MTQPQPLNAAQQVLLSVIRHTPLCRGRSRRIILNYIRKRTHHPIITDFRGVPFILNLDNTTEAKALFGQYNLEELRFMKAKTAAPHAVFVDLGGNSGFYTQNFLAQGNQRTALAIEPNPAMCARIRNNYDLLQYKQPDVSRTLIIENCAVGDSAGTMELDLSGGLGSAQIVSQKGANSISVNVDTFLNVLQRHNITKIDLLKVDIEGYEDRALIPFFTQAPRELLPRHIIIEHTSSNEWQGDLFGTIESKGYVVAGKTRGNMFYSLQ